MKRISSLTIVIAILTAVFLLLSGCDHESNQDKYTGNTAGNTIGIIHVEYARSYESLGELAGEADLIVAGTIDRIMEVVPDEATKDKVDPGSRMWLTRSAFKVEKSVKGDFTDEIIIAQLGALGWAEEYGNPIFEPGERCFLFLREGDNGIYGLLHPDGRFRIEDDKVPSMNFLLPTGQARPPMNLTFWRVDLNDFLSRIIESIKSDLIIPNEEPVISMNLLRVMGGRKDDLSIYEDGTVVFTKQWGLRLPAPDRPPMKAWRIGQIGAEDVGNLLEILELIHFNELEPRDRASDPHTGSGIMSDLGVTISANKGYINNKVFSSGYSSDESPGQYKVYPLILNEIYSELMRIAEEETKEACREEIVTNIIYEYPDGDDK
ncbi:MAG TPA: hypothetical protein G4O15_16155 [Dehalococcoidia bacterium]|nr:hypothetical protein [Dehalococcoidia bacterium]